MEGLRQGRVITWETQQTDYPSVGRTAPSTSRGCPRGAAASWYTYIAHRGSLPVCTWVAGGLPGGESPGPDDPVLAWAEVVGDPRPAVATSRRGQRRSVRASWSGDRTDLRQPTCTRSRRTDRQGIRLLPSRYVHGIPRRREPIHFHGRRIDAELRLVLRPAGCLAAGVRRSDRRSGIPRTGGTRPHLIMWGANVPVTRTPMPTSWPRPAIGGRRSSLSPPDYADNTKFADEWMSPHPGTDGALAMAMGHVILSEFFPRSAGAEIRRLREEVLRSALPGQPSPEGGCLGSRQVRHRCRTSA